MRALQNLARFVRAKDTAEERAEIRAYVIEQSNDLAEAFGVSESSFKVGIESVDDDARLARRLLEEIKRATAKNRDTRADQRARAAQGSADVLATVVSWDGDRASIDLVSILAACLTHRDDLLVFACDAFTVSIPMTLLFDVARLERVDLAGFVDAGGLHIRWTTGGFNFRPCTDATATKIYVNLPARSPALAA